jgi:AbrB family looped-hinge helix DNA binding protein
MGSAITRLTSEGQLTLPCWIQEALGVKPGDYLALTATEGGVLIRAAKLSAAQEGQLALIELVQHLGPLLEAEGITEEEQLDEAIKEVKRETYERHYGRRIT